MDFALSDEQEAFREGLRRFFEERSPSAEVRRAMETGPGFDPAFWKPLASELGLAGLRVPEAFGGHGFGCLELAVAFEEAGRALACAPLLSTAGLATSALLHAADDEAKREWLPALAAGACVATLAWLESDARWRPDESPDGVRTAARPADADGDGDGDGTSRLDGEKRFVVDGASADVVLVAARDARGGLGLYAVRGDAPGLVREPVEPLDPTRRFAHLRFDGAPGRRVGRGDATAALGRTLDEACVLLAAECAGGAGRCLDMAVAYAKQRIQFARPIGSFQAIQHKCAEVLLEVESARAVARWAAWVADERPEELADAAAIAKSVAADAYRRASRENLHIHGGLGFTWEADPQLFLKRAQANETFLGDPAWHRTRLARRLGI